MLYAQKTWFWGPSTLMPKNESWKKVILSLKLFKMFLASNIIVGHSFDIKLDAPRVWSMSGHYTSSTTGRLFKKCQNISQTISQKITKNCCWSILLEEKCCSVRVQYQKNFVGNKFYVHKLHSATRVTRRNSFRPI